MTEPEDQATRENRGQIRKQIVDAERPGGVKVEVAGQVGAACRIRVTPIFQS